jgi:apolipoprotein N-acyltransferase
VIEQKITLKKHFKHIWPYILFSFIMLFIMLYDWANTNESDNKAIYIIYFVFGAVSIINIYLHLEYYFVNRGVRLHYNEEKREIRYQRKQVEIVILPESMKSIEIHQSRFFKKKGGFLTTDNYHFCKFILHDGKKVVITSLLYPDFEYKLKGVTEVKEKTIASILID